MKSLNSAATVKFQKKPDKAEVKSFATYLPVESAKVILKGTGSQKAAVSTSKEATNLLLSVAAKV